MITVETRPVRLLAYQWNAPGDWPELVVAERLHGQEIRYAVPSMDRGSQPVKAGDFIVLGEAGMMSPHVYSPDEFMHKFSIVDEAQS